jgi:L-fuconolactonase
MPIIDSHQHFWQLGLFDYPWMSPELGVLYRDYGPATLEPILKENGVTSTVLVQASNSLAESRWMLSLAEAHPFIAGVVGWVDLNSKRVAVQLEELTQNPKFKGVRHLVESEPNDDWVVQPMVLEGLRTLAARGVSYDLLAHTRHLKHLATIVDHCPDLLLVIDHLAKPPIARRDLSEWKQAIKAAAGFERVKCKLSGLVTEADWSRWSVEDLRPVVEWALEVFGPERLIFGSDYPVCLLAAGYDRVLETFRELLKGLSEKDLNRIFFDNAREFYRLE